MHLAITTNDWVTNLNQNSAKTDAVFIDFKTAFDAVNHRFLIAKLPGLGIPDGLCRWFANFVTGLPFQDRFGNSLLLSRTSESGNLQGTTVGPLIFLLYITDLMFGITEPLSHASYADVSRTGGYEALQTTLLSIERWTQLLKFQVS